MDGKINLGLLLQGCMEGNPKSQGKLYQQFYGYGMNIALRYCKSSTEAEEILNDGFLRVFKNIDKYDTQYPFKPWFRKIIVNQAIDYFRKYEKYNSYNAPIDLPENLADSPITASDDMLPIVQMLSPMYRIVFNLYVMEEYKHQEIAEKLDISIGTSKSNLARAKAKLRSLWAAQQIDQSKTREHG